MADQDYLVSYSYVNDDSVTISASFVLDVDTTTDTALSIVNTGTYIVGNVTYSITGLAAESVDNSDNYFNLAQPSYVDGSGITFVTTDPTADGVATYGPATSTDVDIYTQAAGASLSDFEDDQIDSAAFALTVSAVCYAAGTLIRTVAGDVAVEDLRVGDLAMTSSGAHRPIRWLGHRTVNCRNHPRLHEACPVRIAAHALGANRPARDLLVSPGHAICVDVLGEVLIPAAALINGATIRQVAVDAITYWHVELDRHDILLAENLPAESYFEMGNRFFFQESGVVALDGVPDADTASRTNADFCRPFHIKGALVQAVRSQLRVRAAQLGWRLDASDTFAGLHLVVDGERIEPECGGLVARFGVPAGARDAWLVSTTSRPCDISDSDDSRELGVCVKRLAIDDDFGVLSEIALSDALLFIGFHRLEDEQWRWTDGRARIPASFWKDRPAGFVLDVELAMPAPPRWTAPAERGLRSALMRLSA